MRVKDMKLGYRYQVRTRKAEGVGTLFDGGLLSAISGIYFAKLKDSEGKELYFDDNPKDLYPIIIELPEEQPIPSFHPLIEDMSKIKGTIQNALKDIEVKDYDFINPSHYKKFSVETIDMMELIWGKEATALHCEMCAFKYRLRMGEKPDQPIERDLDKVNWYLNKANELRK